MDHYKHITIDERETIFLMRKHGNSLREIASHIKKSYSTISPQFTIQVQHPGLKSIFETDFKRHSEPRLPSTAQINHQLRLITYLNPGKH